jgi:hypothetical protein
MGIESIFCIENPALEARFFKKHKAIRSSPSEPTTMRIAIIREKFSYSVATNGFLSQTGNMSFHSTIPMAYGAYNSRERSCAVLCEVSVGKHRAHPCGIKDKKVPSLMIPDADKSLDSLIYLYTFIPKSDGKKFDEDSILVASFDQVMPRYLIRFAERK